MLDSQAHDCARSFAPFARLGGVAASAEPPGLAGDTIERLGISGGERDAADLDHSHRIDGGPRAEPRIARPGYMRPLWREVSKLASRSSVALLSAWQALEAAYRGDRISWPRTLILLPMLAEHNAVAWIDRATRVTVRRLQDEVRWALDMRDRTWALFELEPLALGVALEFSSEEAERQMRARYSGELIERIRQDLAQAETSLLFTGRPP